MTTLTADLLREKFLSKGFRLKDKPYELNLFGIRTSNSDANVFDDTVGILYRDEKNIYRFKAFKATTDPGVYYREHPMNVNGTAVIVSGMQHLDCYKRGTHTGYKAIQQCGKMTYIRDNNKNKVLDFLYKVAGAKYFKEVAATNIHRASSNHTSTVVDKWSAGCQVLANPTDFGVLMAFIDSSIDMYNHPNIFDYALFESSDF